MREAITNHPYDLPEDLASAIDGLPLLKMIESVEVFEFSGEPDPADTISLLEYKAMHALKQLGVHASFGCEKAVRVMRDIGNSAARMLDGLGKQKEHKDYPERPSMLLYDREPAVKLKGNFSAINKILADRMDQLAQNSLIIGSRDFSFGLLESKDYSIDVIDSLYWRNDFAVNDRNARLAQPGPENTSVEVKMDLSDPIARLFNMYRNPDYSGGLSDSEITSIRNEIAIHNAIRLRLEERISQLAPKAAVEAKKRVASKSLSWPLSVSAITDNRRTEESVLLNLCLGKELDFRIEKFTKAGRSRKFKEGSPNSFALKFCVTLDEVRKDHASLKKREIEFLKSQLDVIMNNTLPSITKNEKIGEHDWVSLGEHVWMEKREVLHDIWYLKAALLPKFPAGDLGDKDPSLGTWLETAMLLATYECRNEWESYPWWPQCVMDRSKHGKKPRSIKEAVRDCLKRGMRNLLP